MMQLLSILTNQNEGLIKSELKSVSANSGLWVMSSIMIIILLGMDFLDECKEYEVC